MNKREQIRLAAEADLAVFINLVSPNRLLGGVHEELIGWWTRQEAKSHQLTLLPRDHMKSALIAYRVAWRITKNPALRVLYISSTSNLAEKQLKFIKDIITSDTYRYYWPDHVNEDEGKREKWTNSEISLDHPLRKEEGIRDPTVFTGGLTTSLTGLHCDIAVLDDVVVHENAYTEEGRTKVRGQYSLLSSIEGADAEEWVVGTRYHPADLYDDLMKMEQEIYDEDGVVIGSVPIYEVFERQVEDRGDGTGQFLWPRQRRKDGKYFGFDAAILSKKRGQYLDKAKFYAQYYNDPNDPTGSGVGREKFQYYEPKFLVQRGGVWYYRESRLNVYAAIDFAYSLNKKADFTALVVIGIDSDGNIYVLDIDRFKSDRISDYFKSIMASHVKWGFRKLRAEVTVAQAAIVKELKESYIKPNGLSLSIDEHRPTRTQGSKEERMKATLEPRYDNLSIWHYRSGACQVLEEELTQAHPPHDDVKDALTSAIDIAVPPVGHKNRVRRNNVIYHSRFGGVGV